MVCYTWKAMRLMLWCRSSITTSLARTGRPSGALVEEGYRQLAFPFAELAAPSFNMEERWERAHLLGYLRSWSATGALCRRSTGVDPVAELESRLEPVWSDDARLRTVTWPLRDARRAHAMMLQRHG